MPTIDSSYIGQHVTFSVYPASILGTEFENVKVLAILDAESATGLIDPYAMHRNVYPTLPGGTPNDATSYSYVKIQLANGEKTAVGLPWIDDSTVAVQSASIMDVAIFNTSAADVEKVRKALIAAGLPEIEITMRS